MNLSILLCVCVCVRVYLNIEPFSRQDKIFFYHKILINQGFYYQI